MAGGGNASRSMRSRIAANKFRVIATSASWNVTYFACRVTFAPIFTSFFRRVVSDQCFTSWGSDNRRKKFAKLYAKGLAHGGSFIGRLSAKKGGNCCYVEDFLRAGIVSNGVMGWRPSAGGLSPAGTNFGAMGPIAFPEIFATPPGLLLREVCYPDSEQMLILALVWEIHSALSIAYVSGLRVSCRVVE
jgi:hypothetical protein